MELRAPGGGIVGLPSAAGALTALSFLRRTDRLFWWEGREGFVLGARTAPAVFSPDGLVLLGLVSYQPLAGRRKLAGTDGFGRPPLRSCSPGGHSGRGQAAAGGTGCQSKGSQFREVSSEKRSPPETRPV